MKESKRYTKMQIFFINFTFYCFYYQKRARMHNFHPRPHWTSVGLFVLAHVDIIVSAPLFAKTLKASRSPICYF